jgi:predicted GNAT family acetyltransferase
MKVIHDQKDLRFYADIEGEEAELTYTFPDDTVMDFDHTFVPERGRGKGIANKLVEAGLHYAQEKGYQIIPSCPAVSTYLLRHPEYQSLVSNSNI